MKQIKHFLLAIVLLASTTGHAQQQTSTTSAKEFRRGVAAVMFATIGGAVIGLSTLSFYGRPQEHTDNITMGALVGLAAGIAYVSYSGSSKPAPAGSYDFSQTEMQELKTKRTFVAQSANVPVMKFQMSF